MPRLPTHFTSTLPKASLLSRFEGRLFSSILRPNENEALDNWAAFPTTCVLTDPISVERVADLYVTLPTRDGTRTTYDPPRPGNPLPYGHHLAFFGARKPEGLLRADGTDEEMSPPAPFTKRMWAGGRISWDAHNPLLIGKRASVSSVVLAAERKCFDKGKPMIFVTQKLEIRQGGNPTPCIFEERSHVYFHSDVFADREKVFDREVQGIPDHIDFSLKYIPTPVTLFRYSALMFNAHHIHLDKEYCQKEEGYPERLVHGPLTAQMLLEAVSFRFPEVTIGHFEYRATNPLFVNREQTINGAWMDESRIKLWCQDGNGVVGMTGHVGIL